MSDVESAEKSRSQRFYEEHFGDYDEDFFMTLVWEHTPFPFVEWPEVEQALLDWKRKARGGWSDCIMCGRAYRYPGAVMVGGECRQPGCPSHPGFEWPNG